MCSVCQGQLLDLRTYLNLDTYEGLCEPADMATEAAKATELLKKKNDPKQTNWVTMKSKQLFGTRATETLERNNI